MNISEAQSKILSVKENIDKVIVGKDEVKKLLLTAFFSDGHVLLEDVPGTGKTMLSKALSVSIDSKFSRIQFTPDLLPADIVGLNIYNRSKESFEFVPGPIMTNILLADEINRATPRTQSALLEAMQERQVTVDGESRKLCDPFFVIATQNPVETAGTFPLPEAELDRFMMMLSIGAMTVEDEVKMLSLYENKQPIDEISSVINEEEIAEVKALAESVYIHPDLINYIARISEATRNDSSTLMGVSPRGSLALMKAAKTYAVIEGRDYVLPEDIKLLSVPVLTHRILYINRKDKTSKEQYLKAIVDRISVPTEEFNKR